MYSGYSNKYIYWTEFWMKYDEFTVKSPIKDIRLMCNMKYAPLRSELNIKLDRNKSREYTHKWLLNPKRAGTELAQFN